MDRYPLDWIVKLFAFRLSRWMMAALQAPWVVARCDMLNPLYFVFCSIYKLETPPGGEACHPIRLKSQHSHSIMIYRWLWAATFHALPCFIHLTIKLWYPLNLHCCTLYSSIGCWKIQRQVKLSTLICAPICKKFRLFLVNIMDILIFVSFTGTR